MTRFSIFIIALLLTQTSFGQKNHFARTPPEPPTKREMKIEQRNHQCARKNNYSFSDRIKHFPFNLATQIQLVSFPGGIDTSELQAMQDLDSLPRLNDTVCYSKLTEVKNLSFQQVDTLTDILYNYGFRGPTYTGSIPLCYNPRNAILFLDSAGRVFEYVEICFECKETKESSETISLGEMCDQKMDMLKNFFKTAGIKYGTTTDL